MREDRRDEVARARGNEVGGLARGARLAPSGGDLGGEAAGEAGIEIDQLLGRRRERGDEARGGALLGQSRTRGEDTASRDGIEMMPQRRRAAASRVDPRSEMVRAVGLPPPLAASPRSCITMLLHRHAFCAMLLVWAHPREVVPKWLAPFEDAAHIRHIGSYFHFTGPWADLAVADVTPPGFGTDPMYVVQARKPPPSPPA